MLTNMYLADCLSGQAYDKREDGCQGWAVKFLLAHRKSRHSVEPNSYLNFISINTKSHIQYLSENSITFWGNIGIWYLPDF
jgi:hypothetical protein